MKWLKALLLVGLMAGPLDPCFAATLAGEGSEDILDFSGGLNTKDDPSKLGNNYSPATQNFLVDEREGNLVPFDGSVTAGSTGTLTKVNFLFPLKCSDNTTDWLVSDSSIVLATKDFTTYRAVRTQLTPTAVLNAAQFIGKAWLTNQADSVFTWNCSSMVLLNGTNARPDVPRAKYVEEFQGRIFVYNTTPSASNIHFSALVTTNSPPTAINPDDETAWREENALAVGSGDGDSGTALWKADGVLYAGKSNATYGIIEQDARRYFARLVVPDIGPVADDAVSVREGNTYFLNRQGVYRMNGSGINRISDAIRPNIDEIISNLSVFRSNIWDTQAEFNRGSVVFPATTTVAGIVTLASTPVNLNYIGANAPGGSDYVNISGGPTPFAIVVPTAPVGANFIGDLPTMTAWGRCNSCSVGVVAVARNLRTGKQYVTPAQTSPSAFDKMFFTSWCSTFTGAEWTGADIAGSSFAIQLVIKNGAGPSCPSTQGEISGQSFDWFPASAANYAEVTLRPVTTGQYISDIATITTISFWDKFSANHSPNGGTNSFYYKTATSVVNIITAPYLPIVPESIIGSSSTDNRIQWASTMAGVNPLNPPTINLVEIFHNESGAADTRPFLLQNKNRLWMKVSTGAALTETPTYVKSRETSKIPDAWVLRRGLSLFSIARDFDGDLYGGSSTAGVVMLLDVGTNDNGVAIDSIWETPDMTLGDPFREKYLTEVNIDAYRATSSSMTISTSKDGGVFNAKTVDLSGSGRKITDVVGLLGSSSGNFAKMWRFRIRGNILDKPLFFNRLRISYKQTGVTR